jgi:arylsulfatase A-like enzyme
MLGHLKSDLDGIIERTIAEPNRFLYFYEPNLKTESMYSLKPSNLPLAMVFSSFLVSCGEKNDTVPNILFIFSDDHAAHAIGAYGSNHSNPELHAYIQTPNIDRLAEEGMLFTNAFCTNAICGPSRAAILTGKHSHLNGMLNNDTVFNAAQQTFPKILQAGGYATAWIGKWHLFSDPGGFDYWDILDNPGQQGTYYNPIFRSPERREKITGQTATIITDHAIDWLENRRDKEKPFFLAYSHKTPHREWVPGPEEFLLYNDVDLPLPTNFYDDYSNRSSALREQECDISRAINERDLKLVPPPYMNEEQLALFIQAYGPENEAFRKANLSGKALDEWKYQRYVKDYLRSIASMDKEIGRILNYLDETGLGENTIVVYSSDQGFFLGEHGMFDKRWMYEESIRMPLIIRWPGVISPGSRNEQLVQNIDFAPSFLELANLPVPQDIQGKSIVPLLRGAKGDDWRDQVYYHYFAYPDWCMVRPHYGLRTDRYKLIHYYTINEWELFDLEKDPDEMMSVYSSPEYRDIVKMLSERLDGERIATGDTVELKATSRHWK